MTKSERCSKSEARNLANRALFSDFGIRISFVIGNSSFVILFPLLSFDLWRLRLFQRDRPADEEPRDEPHQRKEQHPEEKPGEGEAENTRGHQFRKKVVQQRQPKQRDEKRAGTGDGKPELTSHQQAKEVFAVDVRFPAYWGFHA